MITISRSLTLLLVISAVGVLSAATFVRVRSATGTHPGEATSPQNPTATVLDPVTGTQGAAINVCCTSGGWTLQLSPTTNMTSVQWLMSPNTPVSGSLLITPGTTFIPGANGVPISGQPYTTNVNPPTNSSCSSVTTPTTFYYQAIYTTPTSLGTVSNIVSVTVYPLPQGGPLTASPAAICNDGQSTSTICLGGPVVGTVTWSGCTPPSGSTCCTVGPLTASTTITATITSGPCLPPLVLTTTVVVSQMPVAGAITVTTPMPICAGQSAALAAVGTTGNIDWYSASADPVTCACPAISSFTQMMGHTGPALNTNNLTHTWCYAVRVSDPAGICLPVWSQPATVNVDRPPSAPTIAVQPFICCGKMAQITLTPGVIYSCDPTAGPITYQLQNLSTGMVMNANPGVNMVSSAGNWQAIATTTLCGSATSTIKTIQLDDLAVTITGPCCVCKNGGPVTLTAHPTGGVGPYTYSWTPGGATGQTITISNPTVTTQYSVTVTDANLCKVTQYFTLTVI